MVFAATHLVRFHTPASDTESADEAGARDGLILTEGGAEVASYSAAA